MQKEIYKKTCFLYEQLIQDNTPDFKCGRLYERVNFFPFNARLVIFIKTFIFNKFKNQPTTAVATKYLENIMLMTLYIKHLNPHQATSVIGQIIPNDLDLNTMANYRMNSLTTIIPYPWKFAFYIALEKQSMSAIFMTMVVGIFTNLMTQYGVFVYIYLVQSYKILLRLQIISIHYWLVCLRKNKL